MGRALALDVPHPPTVNPLRVVDGVTEVSAGLILQ